MMPLLGIKVALHTRGNKYSVERERTLERERGREEGIFSNKCDM